METSTKVAIAVGALVVIGGGITAYIILNRKKPALPPASDGGTKEVVSNTASPATNSLVQQAIDNGNIVIKDETPPKEQPYTPPKAQSGCSEVRYDFDKNYNYKKCDGVWFTMKKNITGGKWISLADQKWASAVAKLNAKYPNG